MNTVLNTEVLEKVTGGFDIKAKAASIWKSAKEKPIKATLITLGSLLAADLSVAVIGLGVGLAGMAVAPGGVCQRIGYGVFNICTLGIPIRLL